MNLEDKLRENNIPTQLVEGFPVGIVEDGIVYKNPCSGGYGHLKTAQPHLLIDQFKNYCRATKDWRGKHVYGAISLAALPLIAGVYFGVEVKPEATVNLNAFFWGGVGALALPALYAAYFWSFHYEKKHGIKPKMSYDFENGVKNKKDIFSLVEQQSRSQK